MIHHSIRKMKGLGFIMWHARHEWYHVLLGVLWAWILREVWNEFNTLWIAVSIFGSLVPDLDHFYYFLTYGKSASYTQKIWELMKTRQWRKLVVFIQTGHKHNTNLMTHNYYIIVLLLLTGVFFSVFEWKTGVVFVGAMIIHYMFDIVDDVVMFGKINPNWKRWGKGRLPDF